MGGVCGRGGVVGRSRCGHRRSQYGMPEAAVGEDYETVRRGGDESRAGEGLVGERGHGDARRRLGDQPPYLDCAGACKWRGVG